MSKVETATQPESPVPTQFEYKGCEVTRTTFGWTIYKGPHKLTMGTLNGNQEYASNLKLDTAEKAFLFIDFYLSFSEGTK